MPNEQGKEIPPGLIDPLRIFGDMPSYLSVASATIATSGNTDAYAIVPISGRVSQVLFSALDELSASNTNFITFSITNLGQNGSGTNAILLASDFNTTKVTGGSAIAANTKRTFLLNSIAGTTRVAAGDRIRIRAAVTGTLANTVTFPNYLIKFE